MKQSIYNIIVKLNDDEGYLIYNLLTSNICLVKDKNCFLDKERSKSFAQAGFIVDEKFDEMEYCISKRRKYLDEPKNYKRYTIFPTTKCNARCTFCYENDNLRFNMDSSTVEQTIEFIKQDCKGNKKMRIYWFGGEPTVKKEIIDKISTALATYCDENNISYKASMATNLSLINEEDIEHLKNDWRIDKIEFAFDGGETTHNNSKNYLMKNFNAFKHNIYMIDKLLENEIVTQIRFNIDKYNYHETLELIENIMKNHPHNPKLLMYLGVIFQTPLNKTIDSKRIISMEELADYMIPFYRLQKKYGYINSIKDLPIHPKINNCYATNINSLVIGPKGIITKCQIAPDDTAQAVGDIFEGVNRNENYSKWCENDSFEECDNCNFFPICLTGCIGQKLVYNESSCCKEKYYMDALLNFGYELMSKQEKEDLRLGKVLNLKNPNKKR